MSAVPSFRKGVFGLHCPRRQYTFTSQSHISVLPHYRAISFRIAIVIDKVNALCGLSKNNGMILTAND
jgi:hypothetical protein